MAYGTKRKAGGSGAATPKWTPDQVAKDVTDRIVAYLEEVQAAGERWELPFVPTPARTPVNLEGRPYQGTNWFLLAMMGGPSGLWGTYNAWSAKGAQVRGGERGTRIVFFKPIAWGGNKDEGADQTGGEDERKASGAILKSFVVFRAEQVDGFDLKAWETKHGRVDLPKPGTAEVMPGVEAFLTAYHQASGCKLTEDGGGVPCYIPSIDAVRMPKRAAFKTAEGRYGVWLHEVVHSTGAKSRLDRDLTGRFKSEAYAVEELVAELGAAMGCAQLGVSPEPRRDHAVYIASWLKALKGDKRAIFAVAGAAQKAIDYARGMTVRTVEDDEALPQAA